MTYLRCDFSSKSLEMCTSFIALLPEDVPLGDAPVIYLLHGLSDNCTGWTRLTGVERYAREHNAAVIMPEVQRSFYADMALGLRYFTYISQELPAFCRRTFGLSAARERNFVMGLSMGGYGALKCALTAPERYAGCGAFSSVTDIRARRRPVFSADIRCLAFTRMCSTVLTTRSTPVRWRSISRVLLRSRTR